MSDVFKSADQPQSEANREHLQSPQGDFAPDRRTPRVKTKRITGSRKHGDFFAVDRHLWKMACSLGMNAAIAYLLAARGTAVDMRTTPWSAEAMRVRTFLSWHACHRAFESLIKAGLLERTNEPGKRPRYVLLAPEEVVGFISPTSTDAHPPTVRIRHFLFDSTGDDNIQQNEDWIWLPNALVDRVDDAKMPIELLRQSANLVALRLLIDVYDAQSLAEFGGVDWRHVRQAFDRRQIGERGPHVVWGFEQGSMIISENAPFIQPYLKKDPSQIGALESDLDINVFYAAFELLFDLGLIERVAHAIDSSGSDGALVHPYAVENGEEWERELGRAAHNAGLAMLSKQKRTEAVAQRLRLLPMKKHYQDVQIVGILRTKFRAKTRNTRHWLSQQHAHWLKFHKTNEADAIRPPLGGNRHQR